MIGATVLHDMRAACRRLGRARSFTLAAVLMLTLGIVGTTVMFALIQGVLLRPLPVKEAHRLIVAWKELRSSASAQYPSCRCGDRRIRPRSPRDAGRGCDDAPRLTCHVAPAFIEAMTQR